MQVQEVTEDDDILELSDVSEESTSKERYYLYMIAYFTQIHANN